MVTKSAVGVGSQYFLFFFSLWNHVAMHCLVHSQTDYYSFLKSFVTDRRLPVSFENRTGNRLYLLLNGERIQINLLFILKIQKCVRFFFLGCTKSVVGFIWDCLMHLWDRRVCLAVCMCESLCLFICVLICVRMLLCFIFMFFN